MPVMVITRSCLRFMAAEAGAMVPIGVESVISSCPTRVAACPLIVMTMSAVAAAVSEAGVTQLISVIVFPVMLSQASPPTVMATVWLAKTAYSGKRVPVSVTVCPPLAVTEAGATAVKVGSISTAAGLPVASIFPEATSDTTPR